MPKRRTYPDRHNNRVCVTFTAAEYARIAQMARETGAPMSECVRQVFLSGERQILEGAWTVERDDG